MWPHYYYHNHTTLEHYKVVWERWKLAPSLSSSDLVTLIFYLERYIQIAWVLLTLTYDLAIGDITRNIIHWDYVKNTEKE